MADPVRKPLTWSPAFPAYAEKHDMYRVLQELLKELIINKPRDPLVYIKDELPKIAKTLYSPRVFILGPNIVGQGIGRNIANKTGAMYLTLADIIETSPDHIREVLMEYIKDDESKYDEGIRKLLVSAIQSRTAKPDCHENGYVIYGFPRDKAQAVCAQQAGLLPRQVYIFLPGPGASAIPSTVTLWPNAAPKESVGRLTATSLGSDSVNKASSHLSLPDVNNSNLKDVADSYDFEICTVIPFEKWSTSKKTDIEAELYSNLVSTKPCGAPWIPKILILGPPSSGKSTVAQELSEKFSFIDVDFIELVRGASQLPTDVGKACKKYLGDLQPMNDDIVKILLKRRLQQEDCQRHGWILHGFPDTARQIKILDLLHLLPNRVFLLSCPERICIERLSNKKHEILERRLSGMEGSALPPIDDKNFEIFPYGKSSFQARFKEFEASMNDLSSYFGTELTYVDATEKIQTVKAFVETSIRRPPVIRFPNPNPSF